MVRLVALTFHYGLRRFLGYADHSSSFSLVMCTCVQLMLHPSTFTPLGYSNQSPSRLLDGYNHLSKIVTKHIELKKDIDVVIGVHPLMPKLPSIPVLVQ